MARPNEQRGFVLVATLWVLAIITIAAGYFAERVGQSIAQAQQSRQIAEAAVEMANTRAAIIFRLGTVPLSFYGLGLLPDSAVALDDRPYRGSGDDVIRLQDSRGLINLNFFESEFMFRFLGQFGVPSEKRDALIDTLHDYTDPDDLRRLNGAEAAEYAALKLPPPANDWLLTAYQLKNVIGWRDQASFWKEQRIFKFVTTCRVSGFNPNTAPLEVLASLPGATKESAEAIAKARAVSPILNVGQLFGFMDGSRLDPDWILFFPGDSIRITQQSRHLPWAIQYNLTLTPRSESSPWRIDYHVKTAVTYPIENVEKIKKLPGWSAAPAGREAAL